MVGNKKVQDNMASICKKNESNVDFFSKFQTSHISFRYFDTYTKMHIRAQRAHDRVEGPDFVRVVICSWQLKQVKVTGPSDNSVGTTSWVATEGGAVCLGPKSANWNV